MKALTIKSLSFIICFFCAITFGYGQNVFSNNIDGVNPNFPNNFDPFTNGQNVNPNITVSGIGKGPGVTDAFYDNKYGAVGWSNTPYDIQKYFEFTMTPNSGDEIDFDSFEYNSERSHEFLDSFGVRSSVDGFTSNIGNPVIGSNNIDLSSAEYQNISGAITFRIYAWGLVGSNGGFSIADFSFKGTVAGSPCALSTTWNGTNWNSTRSLSTTAIINDDYDTANGGQQVSFSACRLIVNSGATLTIDDGDYIEIKNDITVNVGGIIIVRPKGAVKQIEYDGTVLEHGSISVEKLTAPMKVWYEYTYWSSPVSKATIGDALTDADVDRRFWYDGRQFKDATKEISNNNATADGQDDIDDDNNDWQYAGASTIMTPGVGYVSTHNQAGFIVPPGPNPPPLQFKYTFDGPFNTGIITVPIFRNDEELEDNNWNLIGNPYPSAIDADLFLSINTSIDPNVVTSGSIDGAIFLWSQNTAPSVTNNGNENSNFDTSDYAIINGTATSAGGDNIIPSRYIPSGQSFFVSMSDTASSTYYSNGDPGIVGNIVMTNITFNNAMRVIGAEDNSQFFRVSGKSSKSNNTNKNKLWVNLSSDNGIFSQAVIGYVPEATNLYDGTYYDAPRNLSTGTSAVLYTNIEGSDKKFAIQGKAENSINEDEVISLGFKTSIDVPTIYTLSIAQLEGDFLSNNQVYIKDNLLNTSQNLKDSDYNFTSEVGEFNERFEIVFSEDALSLDDALVNEKSLAIIERQNGDVQFKLNAPNQIKTIKIIDLQGRLLYNFNVNSNDETFKLSNLSQAAYIAKVTLDNNYVISKKAIKKY